MRQTHMVARPRTLVAGGLAVLVSLTAACGSVMHQAGHRPRMETRHAVRDDGHKLARNRVVWFGDGMVFVPAPRGARPKLTPQQAWANYTKVNTSYRTSAIPRNVSVHLGVLTEAIGPTRPGGSVTYLPDNELVYGYSWHSCPESQGPPGATLPPNPCIEWNFLKADTGRQIVDTWQLKPKLAIGPAKARPATLPQVTYPSEGINVSRRRPAVPGKLAADATSPGTVRSAFMAQGIASVVGSALRTERPAIALRTITELHPTAPGVRPHIPYTGWVVIYRHVHLVSYGPKPFPRNARGTFVAIMNAATGQWTNFFDY